MKYTVIFIIMSCILLTSCKVKSINRDDTEYNLKVEIKDISTPEIIVNDVLEFEENEINSINKFIKIKDNKDIQLGFEINGDIKFDKVGEYELIIKTKDSDNNEASKKILVKIKEKQIPTIPNTNNIINNTQGTISKKSVPSQSNSANSTPSTPSPSIKRGIPKKFLFSDGFNLNTVVNACSEYLNQYNSGSCYPIKDNNTGNYIGMEYIP